MNDSALATHFRCATTLMVACLVLASVATGQSVRVQFIHASPNAEVATMDVYRDGELWLDNFAFGNATAFEDWGSRGRFRLDFAWADDPDATNPFYSTTLTLRAPDTLFISNPQVPHLTELMPIGVPGYVLAVAGDPVNRAGQPAFKVHVMDGALNQWSFYPPFPAVGGFNAVPDMPAYAPHWRGTAETHFMGKIDLYPDTEFGEFMPYVTAPGVLFDEDSRGVEDASRKPPFPFNLVDAELRQRYERAVTPSRTTNGSIYHSNVINFSNKLALAFINVSAGFLHPPEKGDASYQLFSVFGDGSTERAPNNTAHVQWIHNSPYQAAPEVDLYINGFRVVDDLAFRESTPFIELPAGLAEYSAPTLVVDVTKADAVDNTDPLFSKSIRLLFGGRYVAMVAGDPVARSDQPPMDIHLSSDWEVSEGDSSVVSILFAHGAPDMIGASISVADEEIPLASFLGYGAFEATRSLHALRDEVLLLGRAETKDLLARVEPQLQRRGLSDSALVIVTSGFVDPPAGVAVDEGELVLVAGLPSGGPMVPFTMRAPPLKPFWYIVGLFAIAIAALVGYQIRLWRLRTRTRELDALVVERTKALVAEKQKTEDQAQRLLELDEAKNRFFANISHEFRTPLTLILGPLQDALDGMYRNSPDRLEKQFPIMHRSARRLLRLINQLLDLSRLESGKLQLIAVPGDLVLFLRDLTRTFVPLAERRRISLSFRSDDNPITASFDRDALEKVFSNLISNALKFTPENGVVTVATSVEEIDGDPIAVVSVNDDGPGIAADDLSRIFDRFQQADTSIRRRHEGSGVGLTLARELTELHGGTLSVESTVGVGTTFYTHLPLIETHIVDPETPAVSSGNGQVLEPEMKDEASIISGSQVHGLAEAVTNAKTKAEANAELNANAKPDRPSILIVDDNPDVRAYVRSHLETDYRIIEAEDGEAGLERARTVLPDLVLTDVMMPNMDGYELCRLLRASDALRSTPIIMLTAKAADEDTVEGITSGADDYLAKPFRMTELRARVARLIETRRELRSRFSREVVVQPSGIVIEPAEEVFLDQVLEVVNNHLGDGSFSVDWLAGEVGMSRRQLERRVESVVGETPAEMIRRMRMERASQLLRAHAGTVAEIAYAVGYNSASHFSKTFRKVYRVSPTEHASENVT